MYKRQEKQRELLVTLLEDGQAFLGITLEPMQSGTEGVKIARLDEKTPAEKAGLRAGDVIVDVDGFEITSRKDLEEALGARSPGEQVPFTLQRDGRSVMITVLLGRRSTGANGPKKKD